MKRYLVEGGIELKLDTIEVESGWQSTGRAREVLPVGYGPDRWRAVVLAATFEAAESECLASLRASISGK